MGASPIPTERSGYFHPTKCEQPGDRVQPPCGLCLQISRLTNVLPHSSLDPIEAHRGRPQSQAAALRAEEAFIDRVEDGHHKEQEKEHPEGQDKQIGRQRSDPDRTEGEETDSRANRLKSHKICSSLKKTARTGNISRIWRCSRQRLAG